MREIWFKGKTAADGNWVLGFYSRTAYMGKITHVFITEKVTGCLYEILPETLCEYTGLNDSQGVPIFEDDIIMYGSQQHTVEWVEGAFEPFAYSGWEDFIKPSECTVIGNKWDNHIIQMRLEESKDEMTTESLQRTIKSLNNYIRKLETTMLISDDPRACCFDFTTAWNESKIETETDE